MHANSERNIYAYSVSWNIYKAHIIIPFQDTVQYIYVYSPHSINRQSIFVESISQTGRAYRATQFAIQKCPSSATQRVIRFIFITLCVSVWAFLARHSAEYIIIINTNTHSPLFHTQAHTLMRETIQIMTTTNNIRATNKKIFSIWKPTMAT